MLRVALLQSNYLPWRGYFDIIHDVDVCVLYDCVQYTTGDWRNRNRFMLAGKPAWLTIPVRIPPLGTAIHQVRISEAEPWRRRHLKSLLWSYGRSPFYEEAMGLVRPWLEAGEGQDGFGGLSSLNQGLIRAFCGYLGIKTKLVDSRELALEGRGTERILDALAKLGATSYLTGPKAKAYLDEKAFEAAGISLAYKDYSAYPEPAREGPESQERLSTWDLICRAGPASPDFIWGWRR